MKDKEKEMKRKTLDKKLREFRRSPKAGGDSRDVTEPLNSAGAIETPGNGEVESAAGARQSAGKTGKLKRASKSYTAPDKNVDDGKPQTRLGLIRARHESMRREIDQIREDLESDEEE